MTGNQIAELTGDEGKKDLAIEDHRAAAPIDGGAVPSGSTTIPDYDYSQLDILTPEKDAWRYTGRVAVAAATGHEKSWFDGEGKTPIRNSFFTYYFMNGLKKLQGQTERAFEYASVRTWQLVHDLSHGAHTQTPQMHSTPQAGLNIDIFK